MKKFLFLSLLLLLFLNIYSIEYTLEDLVNISLENNPEIKILKKEIEQIQKQYDLYNSRFESQVSSYVNRTREYTPLNNTNSAFYVDGKVKTDYSTYGIDITKQLKNGIEVKNELVFERNIDNKKTNNTEDNKASYTFSLNIPLKKGKGVNYNTADLEITQMQKESKYLENQRRATYIVFTCVNEYWNALKYKKMLNILKESEMRMKQIIMDTEALIKAGEIPSAEKDQLLGTLANRTSQKILCENNLYNSIQQLGIILGIDYSEFENIDIKNRTFSFKDLLEKKIQIDEVIKCAENRRRDLKAAQIQVEKAEKTLKVSEQALKNRVDLNIKIGFNGYEEGKDNDLYFTSWDENIGGLNASATITRYFSGSNLNNVSNYKIKKIDYNKALINRDEIKRQIYSEVSKAFINLKNSYRSIIKTEEALKYYRVSVESEKKKLKLGMTTVIDVIKLENEYNDILIQFIDEQANIMKKMAEFQYYTDNLLIEEDNHLIYNKNVYQFITER